MNSFVAMDVFTQVSLGATVGYATLGKSLGRRAFLLGGLAGWIPDWDTAASWFMNEFDAMMIHRGFTHSVFFALLLSPLLAWACERYFKNRAVGFWKWTLFFFLCLFTHSLLDAFTAFGTQLLNPISDTRFAFNGVFFIDPLYSLPLLFGILLILLVKRIRRWGVFISRSLLILTTSFLLFNSLFVQNRISKKAKASLEILGIKAERSFTYPMATAKIWYCVVESDKKLHYGFVESGMRPNEIQWNTIGRNLDLKPKFEDGKHLKTLEWFSGDWYALEIVQGDMFFYDLRFPKYKDFGIEPDNPLSDQFVFGYQLSPTTGNLKVERLPSPDLDRMAIFAAVFRFIRDGVPE